MTRHLSDTTLTVDQLQSGFGSIRPSGHLPPAERAKWMPTIGTPVELDGQMYGVASLSFSTGAVTYTLHPIIATESAFAWGDRAKDAPLAGVVATASDGRVFVFAAGPAVLVEVTRGDWLEWRSRQDGA